MANDTNYEKGFKKVFSDYMRMHSQPGQFGAERDLLRVTNEAFLYAATVCCKEEEDG